MRIKDCLGKKIYRTKPEFNGVHSPLKPCKDRWVIVTEVPHRGFKLVDYRERESFIPHDAFLLWDDDNWALVDEEISFHVGDRVSWNGLEGVVVNRDDNDNQYERIKVKFGKAHYYFSERGYYIKGHIEPSLKLIERPKKKIKRTYHMASWKDACTRVSSNLYLNKLDIIIPDHAKDVIYHEMEIAEEV